MQAEFQTKVKNVDTPLDNCPGMWQDFTAQIMRVHNCRFLSNFLRSVLMKQHMSKYVPTNC